MVLKEIPRLVRVEVAKLSLKSGETLCIHVPAGISQVTVDMLKGLIATVVPKGVRVMVVPPGFTFSVLGDK